MTTRGVLQMYNRISTSLASSRCLSSVWRIFPMSYLGLLDHSGNTHGTLALFTRLRRKLGCTAYRSSLPLYSIHPSLTTDYSVSVLRLFPQNGLSFLGQNTSTTTCVNRMLPSESAISHSVNDHTYLDLISTLTTLHYQKSYRLKD